MTSLVISLMLYLYYLILNSKGAVYESDGSPGKNN